MMMENNGVNLNNDLATAEIQGSSQTLLSVGGFAMADNDGDGTDGVG